MLLGYVDTHLPQMGRVEPRVVYAERPDALAQLRGCEGTEPDRAEKDGGGWDI